MSNVEAAVAIITTLFMAGGPIVAMINARAAKKPEITTFEADVNAVTETAKELGIEERWKKYADDLEARLTSQIQGLREDLLNNRRYTDSLAQYAEALRMQIQRGEGPPPLPWPDDFT